nr:ATP-binding cassette domain-containing protein [Paraburkholderia sp. Ac-20347]
MSVPAIRIEGLSKHFQHGNTSRAVLENLTLDVAQGEFLVLLGPSGCGKSTLLRILAGLSVQDRGTVGFSHAAPKRGMVFQSYSAFEWLSVEDNVAFGLKLAGVPRNTRRERARRCSIVWASGRMREAGPPSFPAACNSGWQSRDRLRLNPICS